MIAGLIIGFSVATVAYGKVGDALLFLKNLFNKATSTSTTTTIV
jgi:hypothetical protein